MKKPDLAHLQTEGLKRWRQWRRMHAARTVSERRLLVVAGVALTWFLLDQVLVTPGYQTEQGSRGVAARLGACA
jgi:hypothetical protein